MVVASWLLAVLIVFGIWQSGLQLPLLATVNERETMPMQVKVFVPIAEQNRCLRPADGVVIRDLTPPRT